MRRSLTLVLALMFLMTASAALAAEPAPAPSKPAAAAEPAPAPPKPAQVGDALEKLTLTTLDGKSADIALDKGMFAISFFNSACSACKAEMQLLDAFAMQNKKLKLVGVCVDAAGAKTATVFVENQKLKKFDYYIDPGYTVPQRFGFAFTPSLVVIQDGKITMKHAGFMNKDEEELAKVLLK